jgi:hypothetical protein
MMVNIVNVDIVDVNDVEVDNNEVGFKRSTKSNQLASRSLQSF